MKSRAQLTKERAIEYARVRNAIFDILKHNLTERKAELSEEDFSFMEDLDATLKFNDVLVSRMPRILITDEYRDYDTAMSSFLDSVTADPAQEGGKVSVLRANTLYQAAILFNAYAVSDFNPRTYAEETLWYRFWTWIYPERPQEV